MTGLAFFAILTGLIVWLLGYPHVTLAGIRTRAAIRARKLLSPKAWASALDHLQKHYVAAIFIVGLLVLVWAAWAWIWRVPGLIARLFDMIDAAQRPDDTADSEAIRNIAYAIGALLAALAFFATLPFQLVRVWVNERQTRTVEQGHVTDRLTRAIEQLGAEKTVKRTITRDDGTTFVDERTEPNIEVRLGAIYALERIAQDSERDHIPVMETLCAYVRENAPARDVEDSRPPRADIQAVMDVINRRSKRRITWERFPANAFRLNLARACLQGADLREARLEGADLQQVRLEGASLTRARLEGAFLFGARLEGADLHEARLQRARLIGARLHSADLSDWSCDRASLRSADLLGALNLDPASVKAAFGVRAGVGRTILPEGMDYPEHWHVAADVSEDGPEHFKMYWNAYDSWLATLVQPPGI